MEDFLHVRPPFAFGAVAERFLAGFAVGPLVAGGGIGGNFRHVCGEVSADVFEVAEEVVVSVRQLAQEDRVVANVACGDQGQDFRPCGGMQTLVLLDLIGPEADDAAVAFHGLGASAGGAAGVSGFLTKAMHQPLAATSFPWKAVQGRKSPAGAPGVTRAQTEQCCSGLC